ncbi:helix-turn-helix transcriptional regulator [Longispora sp. K20-0274]|uniref:helix-turn-helix domain-containing protein n=1 Tax=Longispora sp. K20-0274 TaxID=3088255 RepID=UPI003999C9CB
MAKRDKDKDIPLRARWLGAILSQLRDDARLTLVEAGDYLGKNPATVSRFESGEYPIQSKDLLTLLDLYRVTDLKQRSNLLQHCEELGQRGWWDGYAAYVDRKFIDAIWLEQRAKAIRSVDLLNIPGLLQTQHYMEALITDGPDSADKMKVRRTVELRLSRQQIFDKASSPRLDVVLHESVLCHVVGGHEVMREQLDHLASLPKSHRVRLRVLPMDSSALTRAGCFGPFRYFELVEPYPDVAQVETMTGSLYVETPDADVYEARYDQVWRSCLSETASADLIATVARGLTDDGDRTG